MKSSLKITALLALAFAFLALPARPVRAEDDEGYTFKVHNATKERITKLLASEDGKDYATFDIGQGVEPGETMKLSWDKSTDGSNCEWYIKAVYADGSASDPGQFNFCEDDLVLDF